MGTFVSTHRNKIDGKGRVSIPAQFRSALGDQLQHGIYLVPPLDTTVKCLEGWPHERMQKLVESMDVKLETMPDDEEDLTSLVLAESENVNVEDNGRIHVPADMVTLCGFEDTVVFVGCGGFFQMWSPEHHTAYKSRLDAAKRPGANRTIRRIIASGRRAT